MILLVDESSKNIEDEIRFVDPCVSYAFHRMISIESEFIDISPRNIFTFRPEVDTLTRDHGTNVLSTKNIGF